ncbi:hypothetical protein [Rhodococcus sp. IEGM 1330]|uniref:hypothetical protein n=1 Tax=Rhodococcus sp. IEGM 1330 TaxID=3082225 RepID=UPI002954653A|nr:hypothetical protein [Rhodococcus sp. IEGM 1330]MDV8022301.1 hypothetical protein [Rhodococcus sp. IEGM 1330]
MTAVTVTVPVVGHKPEGMEDAEAYARAATNLRGNYQVGGSNMRAAVALLLDRVCIALDSNPGASDSDVNEGSVVREFIRQRHEYVVAARNSNGSDADYFRWQGHMEARRQLAQQLGLPYEFEVRP